MKSVLISIQPKWVEKIARGEKTIEVRKSRPKIETPFKCYIYATKPKKWYRVNSFAFSSDESLWLSNGKVKMCNGLEFWADGCEYEHLSGKVIGEFVCDSVEMVNASCSDYGIDLFYHDCATQGCITESEIDKYFSIPKDKDLRVMKGNGYAWQISNLKIYDKPKELSEFCKPCNDSCDPMYGSYCIYCDKRNKLTRPPQSWCYVEENENGKYRT